MNGSARAVSGLLSKRDAVGHHAGMAELVVADDIAREAVRRFESAAPRTMALAGGSTPRTTYERLAVLAYPWAETQVFFGDERCVPPDDPDSNYRMAYDTLLSKVITNVHRMPGEACDAEGYEWEFRAVFGAGVPRLDLVFLGLGADGHTASLFPGDAAALEERERLVVRVQRPDHERLSLTLPVLSAAKLVLFLVSGAEKREALAQLLHGGDIPAAKVAAEQVVVIADRAAAGA